MKKMVNEPCPTFADRYYIIATATGKIAGQVSAPTANGPAYNAAMTLGRALAIDLDQTLRMAVNPDKPDNYLCEFVPVRSVKVYYHQ